MREVVLSPRTPRDASVLASFDLERMLRVWRFLYCLLFLQLLALLPALAVALGQGRWDGPAALLSAVFLACVAGGWMLRRWVAKRRKMRERAILHGVICPARITGVRFGIGLGLVLFGLDRRVDVEVQMPDGAILHTGFKVPHAALASTLVPGTSTHALVDPASSAVLVPAELDCSIAVA